MSGVRPIPRRFLPPDMEVRVPDGHGGFGAPVGVRHVRFEREQVVLDDGVNDTNEARGTIYVDATMSDGAFEVPAGSRVSILGMDLYVRRCARFEGTWGEAHHWEIEVD